MEGFLQVLVRKKFTKFWCVLEAQKFSFYDRIDLVKQESVDLQGIIDVKNAEITLIAGDARDFCISIAPHDSPKDVQILDCGDNNTANTWYRALSKAAIEHETEKKRVVDPIALAKTLALEIESPEELSQHMIKKAYRKISLKEHPDKGGDVVRFKEIQTAYVRLMAYQVDVDERATCDDVDYEAVIEKGGNGVGLGIVVEPDQHRQRIVVQTVQKEILLRHLSEEAEGEILPGDVLSYIEKDDCSKWPMSRLRARLNGFRVPVGSSVRIVFTRRVPRTTQQVETTPSPLSPSFAMDTTPDNITPRASPKRFRNPSADSPRYQSPRRESPRRASPLLPPVPDMIGAEEISIAPLDAVPSTDVSVADTSVAEPPPQPPLNQRSTSITSTVANNILLNEIDAYISVVDDETKPPLTSSVEASFSQNNAIELNDYREKLTTLQLREKSLNELNISLQQKVLSLESDCDSTKAQNMALLKQLEICQAELGDLKEKIEVLTSALDESDRQSEAQVLLFNLDHKQETAAATRIYSSIQHLIKGTSIDDASAFNKELTSTYAKIEARGATLVEELDGLLLLASKYVSNTAALA